MSIQQHISDFNNPHGLTKQKIGLGNVQNFPMATQDEVISMSRTDVYIEAYNKEWIGQAFNKYIVDLGILDQDGNFLLAQTNTNGEIQFYEDLDGVIHLLGTNVKAFKVKATVFENDVALQTYDNVLLSSSQWVVDVSSLTFDPAASYRVEVENYDSNSNYLGKQFDQLILMNSDVNFEYNPDTRIGVLKGLGKGFTFIDIILNKNGSPIKTFLQLPVSAQDLWSANVSDIAFDLNATYRADVTYYTEDVAIEEKQYIATVVNSQAGTLTYVDPESGDTYYDFRNVADLSNTDLTYIDAGELI